MADNPDRHINPSVCKKRIAQQCAEEEFGKRG
jgi:hypothetical protein